MVGRVATSVVLARNGIEEQSFMATRLKQILEIIWRILVCIVIDTDLSQVPCARLSAVDDSYHSKPVQPLDSFMPRGP